MKKYYTFKDITFLFTDLVKKNFLVKDITFVDFKLRNYRIMNNYCKQMKYIHSQKGKNSTNLTASCSLAKQPKHFKELESEVKKITKKPIHLSKKSNMSGSHSYTNLLVKNIEKMLKNYKDNTILQKQNIQLKSMKKINDKLPKNFNIFTQERLYTTPQDSHLDTYGLQDFKYKKTFKKIEYASMISPNQSKLFNFNKPLENLRHQTQYDTQNIFCNKLEKKKQKSSKKSITKIKSLSFSKKNSLNKLSRSKMQKLAKK